MIRVLTITIAIAFTFSCKEKPIDPDMITGQTKYKYLTFVPDSLPENGQYPLMIFLHGAGERGTDLELLKVHGPPKLASTDASFPFLVVAPQCPKNEWWDVRELTKLLNEIIASNKVDESRIYLTGLSMGGFGSWEWAKLLPDRFAAIVPICGGNEDTVEGIEVIKNVPVWTFHGAKDQVVPIAGTEAIVSRLKAVGSDVKFTVFPDHGHDSWTDAYSDPNLYTWLMEHTTEGR